MKNIFLLLLLMCQASLAMAQSKLDLQSQMRLSNLRMEQKQLKAGGVRRMPSMNNSMNTMPVGYTLGIVKMADNATETRFKVSGKIMDSICIVIWFIIRFTSYNT